MAFANPDQVITEVFKVGLYAPPHMAMSTNHVFVV